MLGVLPLGWTNADIGSPGLVGGASYASGVYSVSGAGGDVFGTSDKFNYAYQPFTGDLTVTARIDSQQNTDPTAKSGVMIRETTASGSKHAFVQVTPDNGLRMQYRSTTNGSSTTAQNDAFTAPYWVRLVRSGDNFSGYRSPDGVNWTLLSTVNITMSSNALVGLAVCSHDDAELNTTTFSNVTMPQNFSLSAAPASKTVPIAHDAMFSVSLTALNGFSGTAVLSASGLPTGTTAIFDPPSIGSGGTSTLTLTTTGNTPVGTFPITLTGTSGALVRSTTVTLRTTANLIWNSNSSTVWDTTTSNWFDEQTSSITSYTQGKAVLLTDRAGVVTNLTIASGVAVTPSVLTIDAETTAFSISGAGKISGSGVVTKLGSGTVTISSTNDYTGGTTISGGILSVSVLTDQGTASPVGTAGVTLDGGTLRWTGNTNTSANRNFTLTPNGGILDASPSATATLTLSGTISFTGSGNRALTLAGSYPSALKDRVNVFASVLANPSSDATALIKNGNNTWSLSGVNTYSGGTTVNAGRLKASQASGFGSGEIDVAAGGEVFLNAAANFSNPFSIAGVGPAEAYGSFGALRLGIDGCVLSGNVVLADDARITARGTVTTGAQIAGQITGDGGLELGGGDLSPETFNIPASTNAYVLRTSTDPTATTESQTLRTKGLADSNARIAYVRFDAGAFLDANLTQEITTAFLRLYLADTATNAPVMVYALVNRNVANVDDDAWTGEMIWNTQPARTAAPNDIPSTMADLTTNANVVLLGTATINASNSEVSFPLNVATLKTLLNSDTNGQITLLFHNTSTDILDWSSISNTGNHLVPTLQFVVTPSTSGGVLTLSNSANDWAGDTTISQGTTKLGASNTIPHGEEKGNVVINNSKPSNNSTLDLNGFSTTINGLSSAGTNPFRCIVTNGNAAATTLTVGDNDAAGTFGGVIQNGTGVVALTKIGAGVQSLSGANTYTGATTISNGTLLVNGSLANSPVTVQSGATFGGNCTINGAVTVNAGGTISPSISIGVLTATSSVVLQGTTAMEVNKSAGTKDQITGATTITYGGILSVTNLAGTLAANDSFKLFTAGSYLGNFTSITPTYPGAGLLWDTSSLTTDGTLKIVAASPSQTWRMQHFGTHENLGDAADLANPAGDGIVNLMKYALDIDPTIAAGHSQPTVSASNNALTMQFHRNLFASDISYAILASSDLTNWTTVASRAVGATTWSQNGATVTDDNSGAVTVIDAAPISEQPKRFLKLTVTRP